MKYRVRTIHEANLAKSLTDDDEKGWETLSATPVYDRGNPQWGLIYYSVLQKYVEKAK